MSMDSTVPVAAAPSLAHRNITTPLGPVGRYRLRYAALLTFVPFLCGIVLLLLLSVFSKLNLFYLETSGLVIDDQIRDAYYTQVQTETMSVAGFLLLQLVVTAIVSVVVMRWASAPFTNAARTIETAVSNPEKLRPLSRWFSESPYFDRVVWLFALRIKNGGDAQLKDRSPKFVANLLFLVKFWCSFAILSVITGYFMGIIISTVYGKIIALAFDLVKNANLKGAQHFFAAQQEVLIDATWITTATSLVVYFVIGVQISRYMTTMIYVFARAIEEDRFPVQLRADDVYQGLAVTLNRAREKIR